MADTTEKMGGGSGDYPVTPDGRYFVVRGRLWRRTNPALTPDQRERFVRELMRARNDVKRAKADQDEALLRDARGRVHAAKVALGERGPVWWYDGAPDYNRRMAANTPYRDWYAGLSVIMAEGTGDRAS
jgi:hypothetical protein